MFISYVVLVHCTSVINITNRVGRFRAWNVFEKIIKWVYASARLEKCNIFLLVSLFTNCQSELFSYIHIVYNTNSTVYGAYIKYNNHTHNTTFMATGKDKVRRKIAAIHLTF